MTVEIRRLSPLTFADKILETENHGHWPVVQEYEAEGQGPWVIDLSHHTRWDLQDSNPENFQPLGIVIPETAGQCVFENGALVNRMNRTQTAIWHLAGTPPDLPDDPAYTETTDATLFVALVGENIFSVAEKLTGLDFRDATRTVPFLYQGPFAHVPCQIVTLQRNADNGAILLTCSRGYGKDMGHAIMDAGEEFGLKPAGEKAFLKWIESLSL